MKHFDSIAIALNHQRHTHTNSLQKMGFVFNRRGVMQKTLQRFISIRVRGQIKPLGLGLICYADQDPTEESPEAELVRSGRWKAEDIGKLWAYVNNQIINLAQVDPSEPAGRLLHKGFVTEDGQWVIDQED